VPCSATTARARPPRAVDQGERRLQRVDVADLLAALEQVHVEVGDGAGLTLPWLDQAAHLLPGVLDLHAGAVWPVNW